MDKVESICNYLEGESFDSGKIFDFSYMPQKNETRMKKGKKEYGYMILFVTLQRKLLG